MSTIAAKGKGARAGLAMKTERGFIKTISKAATIGGTYRMFIPTFVGVDDLGQEFDDLLIGFGAGRKLDFEIFNTTFMTYPRNWYEDENNIPRCKVGCDQFSRISRVILEAQCNSEKEAAKKAADEIALANGGQRDEVALIRKLDRIDEYYHGRDAEDGAQRIYAKAAPFVGKLDYFMVAEVLLVPMDSATNTPNWAKAIPAQKVLSKQLLEKIFTIMETPSFFNREDGFIELAFKYGSEGQKSNEAGLNATYNGVPRDMSLKTAFPDLWLKMGAEKVAKIAGGERDIDKANDLILKRTGFKPGAFTSADCKSKFLKWVSKNTVILLNIDVTDDYTKYAAKDMIELGIVDKVSTVKSKLQEIVDSQGADDEDDAPDEAETAVDESVNDMAPTDTPTVDDNISNSLVNQASDLINSGAPIGARVGQNIAAGGSLIDDDELGDLLDD